MYSNKLKIITYSKNTRIPIQNTGQAFWPVKTFIGYILYHKNIVKLLMIQS